MKVKLLCPKCYKEERIKYLWKWWFHEDYLDFKKYQKELEDSFWQKELPKIQEDIEKLVAKYQEIENSITEPEMRRKLLDMKSIHTELQFLYGRLKYRRENENIS